MESRANRVIKDDNVDLFFYLNRGKRLSKVYKIGKVDSSINFVLIFLYIFKFLYM